MEKTITKEMVRKTFLYLVGYLTKNAGERVASTTKELAEDIKDETLKEVLVMTLKEMLKIGWANRQGSPRYPIYTSTCKMDSSKLKDAESINAAVEELWPAFERTMRTGEPVVDNPDTPFPEREQEAEVPNHDGMDPEFEEPITPEQAADDLTLLREIARRSPDILVKLLRDEGWEVTARKVVTVEL